MKKAVVTAKAPGAIGPYSQGIQSSGMLYISGQIPADPVTGLLAEGIREQTRRSLLNCAAILEEAGLSLTDVVKTTVYISDMKNFGGMNEIYADFFSEPYPARSTVEVSKLPRDAGVEIEMIAAF